MKKEKPNIHGIIHIDKYGKIIKIEPDTTKQISSSKWGNKLTHRKIT